MLAINFLSSKDTDKEYVIHSKRHTIEIMINVETDEITE